MIAQLSPTRPNLHGHWSRDLPPVLTVESGDVVRFSCLDAMWCDGRPGEWPWKRVEPRDEVLDGGHALTGPVAVRGAGVGMTLAVSILAIVPGEWGWTWSGPQGERARELGVEGVGGRVMIWDVDSARMVARESGGEKTRSASGAAKRLREFRLSPFMGVMGVAPALAGVHATTPPGVWGGNMDCKELVAGTVLYLPVGVEGALFSVGDGHGLQGDGEVCGTAIECPMERVDLRFEVIDRPLKAPRAKTADSWITFGFDADLNRASIMALNGMLDLMEELYGVGRQEALALASLVVDLRVTQIVNQVQGVHAVLRDGVIGG